MDMISFPASDDGAMSIMLRRLTKAINDKDPATRVHGVLGGDDGYGASWDSDVFMMHPYCWCEKEDCPWCGHGEANFHHKPSGVSVTWYKYIGRSMEINGEGDLAEIGKACLADVSG